MSSSTSRPARARDAPRRAPTPPAPSTACRITGPTLPCRTARERAPSGMGRTRTKRALRSFRRPRRLSVGDVAVERLVQHRAGALALVLPMTEQECLVPRRGVVEVELAVRAVLEARERRIRAEERRQEDVGEPARIPGALRVGIERPAGHRAAQEAD